MENTLQKPPIREAVGIFFDADELKETILDLKSAGFHDEELGLLGDELNLQNKLCDLYKKLNKLSDNPDAPQTAFVKNESRGDTVHALTGILFLIPTVIIGAILVALAAVFIGVGMVVVVSVLAVAGITAVILIIIHQSDAEYLEMQVDHDRLLLFVRTRNKIQEKKAIEILKNHSAYNPKIYSVRQSDFVTA